MLSYQHSYHAGSRADTHKHDLLSRVLEALCRDKAPLDYFETHAGRGIYDLTAKEANKTGEAGEGWLKLCADQSALKQLSPSYVECVRALNKGKLAPRYPGSPGVAAYLLRPDDTIHLAELHPTEHAALKKNMAGDKRVHIFKEDGFEMVLKQGGKKRGLVLIDPSYEVKAEYETLPELTAKLVKSWPDVRILIWAPMLTALRPEAMIEGLKKNHMDLQVSQAAWAKAGEVRGMYGSIMMGINAGDVFQKNVGSLISKL